MTEAEETVDVVEWSHTQIDLLDRQSFVDKLINITEIIAKNEKNICYAVNGLWGVEKSYVLDMFEHQISQYGTEETALSKYLVFHYNCWQYDFYEEPLVAIIAVILDTINEQTKLFSEDTRVAIQTALKKVGHALLLKTNKFIAEKTGIDCVGLYDSITEISHEYTQSVSTQHAFDTYFEFKKVIEDFRKSIRYLAQSQTVIFVVDELDRCLPEYAIKVLERLHHVFSEIPNIQVILSIDKTQLEHTIEQIYGYNTSTKKYLAKFIDFEIDLDVGHLNDQANERFKPYYAMFSISSPDTSLPDVEEFKLKILDGIDVRERISILEKCSLLHNMLNRTDETSDYVYMCIEILLTLFKYYEHNKLQEFRLERFNVDDAFFCGRKGKIGDLPQCFQFIQEKWKQIDRQVSYYNKDQYHYYVKIHSIWGVLLGCYRLILGSTDDKWIMGNIDEEYVKDYVKKFWNLLKIVN